jgi:hypothetical protein
VVASKNIRWNIGSSRMTQMDGAVGIRPGYSDKYVFPHELSPGI